MKILLVNDDSTPAYGSHLLTLWLRDGLLQKGHDARIFSSSARPLVKHEVLAEYQCLGTSSRLATLFQTMNPWAYLKLQDILRKFRPDVVHIKRCLSQLSPLILPLLKNVPAIFHPDGYRSICPLMKNVLPDNSLCNSSPGFICYQNGCLPLYALPPNLFELWLWRRWRSVFDYSIAISHIVKKRLMLATSIPVEVIWNPVSERSPRPPLTSQPTVGFAGRFVSEKGIHVLVNAFASVMKKVPEARLLIVGNGPEERRIRQLISKQHIDKSVTLTGHLLRDEVEQFFDAVWVQIVPSLWEEPFGLVAPEAMMRGTAVIASRIGGLTETVQHEKTGLLVPPNDVQALSQAMLKLLKNRDFTEQMGRAGREYCLVHFNQQDYIDKILNVYHKLPKA